MAPYFNLAVIAVYLLYTPSFVSSSPHGQGHGTKPFGHRFSVHQVSNHHYTNKSGPAAYQFALAKYGVNLKSTSSSAKLNAGKVQGSVVANPGYAYYDREYLCPVQIGTPAQTLPLDFDTGSSDLWVFSSETPTSSVTTGKAVYNVNSSTTSQLLRGAKWTITYGDGSYSSGDVFKDVVKVGPLTVQSQGVESAQTVSTQFAQDGASSGLLGLAFSTINQVRPVAQQQLTWFDNIKTSLAAPLFTANLQKGASGSYNFGYIDKTLYTGSLSYVPVNSRQYGLWEFTASGYAIGNSRTSVFNSTTIDAIADTGTSLMLLPSSIVTAYYKQVTGAYYTSSLAAYIYPCANTPPAFIFGIGTARQVIPGNYMNYGSAGNGYCYGGIQSKGSLPFSVFGDIALKAQFVVFDMGGLRLGFANKKTS